MKRKKRKVKINWKKLFEYLSSVILITYFLICCIAYTIKTDKQIKNYMPEEATIILK